MVSFKSSVETSAARLRFGAGAVLELEGRALPKFCWAVAPGGSASPSSADSEAALFLVGDTSCISSAAPGSVPTPDADVGSLPAIVSVEGTGKIFEDDGFMFDGGGAGVGLQMQQA